MRTWQGWTRRRLTGRTLALALGLGLLVANGARAQETEPATAWLTGRLLVATQEMRDPQFTKTVIYMLRHDERGALGLIINRPLGEMPLSALGEGLAMEGEAVEGSVHVHVGGPVGQTSPFILHSADLLLDQSETVEDGVAFTRHADMLRAIAKGEGPKRSLFILGYAGWGPGQLEAEFARGGWGDIPSDLEILFDGDDEAKWDWAISQLTLDL